MFGYVTPYEGELKVKEQSFYKSVYCGLCRAMGKRVCASSRMTLSYDMVFLVLLRFLIVKEKVTFRTTRCGTSLHKKRVIVERNGTLDYCAAAGSLLAYHNLADDVADKTGARRLLARILCRSARRMRRKAALPELDAIIEAKLKELSAAEGSGEVTVDGAASLFGELLSAVFAYGLDGDGARIAAEVGCHIGKWIYIADAADDYEKDQKHKEFNPLPRLDKATLRCSLNLELSAAASALALLDVYDEGMKNILDNILYLGMPARMEKILGRYPDNEKKGTADL